MQLVLYTVSDDRKVVNKTLGTAVATYNNYILKQPASVQDPILRIQSGDNLSGVNYCYLPRYNRYYFVNKVEATPNGYWELTCHVDVLMSRKDAIRDLKGTITRSETIFNGYLPDSQYKAYAYKQIVTRRFPSAINSDTFILMTVG